MREDADQHEEPQVMDSTAFETRLGVRPTPLPEAVAATVDWLCAALAARA
ncbi:hypothetical protein [Micromonospora sp. NPDC023737]